MPRSVIGFHSVYARLELHHHPYDFSYTIPPLNVWPRPPTESFFFFLQPTRLNVFKNDQDTWDYTNPSLSGQGKAHTHFLVTVV